MPELHDLAAKLKSERIRQGLSLTAMSKKSGLNRGQISRLENGFVKNPTLRSLYRYASAIGSTIKISFDPIDRKQMGRCK